MKILKEIILYSIIGIGFGTLLHYIITTFILDYSFSPVVPNFASKFNNIDTAVGLQLLVFALIGVSQGFARNIFKQDNYLFRQSIIHYFLITLPLLLGGYYLHWFELDLKKLLRFLIFVSLIYFILFLIFYFSTKKKIDEINKKLSKNL
ncbi:DUF3021 domain-containing protein [Gemella sp. zg-570]|uniref:DUF3021 domain-containing protein n=1 Tax=Gemella sp. zg-570 TaxID=2840371 RepID=UPI001C0D74D6|nr:DUF3021 domain-containing protein [Gemella sp. zg-570]QWQ39074.1 DUF3021 domain-containing protein [Gemella sp. zg-570]